MSLLPIDQALEIITSTVTTLPVEEVPLKDAHGRVSAADHCARLNQPPFNASAMDGYAVRAEDLENNPTTLDLIGEAPAGRLYQGDVTSGTAVRIFTGGALPDGADSVVIQENTERPDDTSVTILKQPDLGQNIRRKGNDFQKDQTLLGAGESLTSRHIGMLAAANIANVKVFKRPRVALLSTGDELRTVGQDIGPGQIVNSNSFLLGNLIRENGAEVQDLGVARDTEASLREKIAAIKDADLLITIGGASVGDHDIVQDILVEEGLKVDFWKVAMRPGKPLIFGKFSPETFNIPMFGLPGNPASAYVCAVNFLLPALHIMQGRKHIGLPISQALLAHDLPENGPRQHYMRAHFSEDETGSKIVTPTPSQDSAKLSTLAASNCLLLRAPNAPAAQKGERTAILILSP